MKGFRFISMVVIILGVSFACTPKNDQDADVSLASGEKTELEIVYNEEDETISVYRAGETEPILTQHAREDFRPYIHPIAAPDGRGVLTEDSPGHHTHQTGLYWGFTRMNDRDFFHNTEGDYWRKVSAGIVERSDHLHGNRFHDHDHSHDHDHGHDHEFAGYSEETDGIVQWQTVYDLLDENGEAMLTETQNWSMTESGGTYILDLEWRGRAHRDITISEFDYGGLFLRMPWREGMPAEVVNAVRDRNERAEGQRAMWLNLSMQVEGRDDFAHIAIFDHSENEGFPTPWRVDGQFGVGPATAVSGDWHIEEGGIEIIRYRIVVYTGEFSDVEVTAAWEDYVENHGTYSTAVMWGFARRAGMEAEFLTPDEAAENMTLLEGFNVTAWAGEPQITTPMAFAWDDRGRLWVAENNDYETRGTGFSAAGNSRILILEDTNRDGYADSRKVFLEGIAFPAAIAIGYDGLFLGAPPNLLFVPFDEEDSDKADIDNIDVLLTGWGIDDRHETINSLHWGPDGWLYGLHGIFTHSKVGKPKPGIQRVYTHNDPFPDSLDDLLDGEGIELNGGVWRYHPLKDRFEVVAHGLSNPWGIDHDAKGQLFATACVIPHLWHIVPGGAYHRQGGSHFNPYVYEDIKTIADHRHRSAHGGASIYLSDAFPENHFGRIFMANIHEHAVLSDILERSGSGFTASHGDDFALANNAAWVGFSTEIGPDGGLYILDWHDRDICGTSVQNEDTGRIFKIMPEQSLAEEWEGRYQDVSEMKDDQLVTFQTKNSAWHARRARVNLQYRASKGILDEGIHEKLHAMFQNESNPDWRLRAMWTLHVTEGFSEDDLIDAMDDGDEYIRSWAIQLLAEDFSPPQAALSKFTQMAENDESPVVRLYLASLLQRLDHDLRWDIAEHLMLWSEDSDDHNIPNILWLGFEPLVELNPERALSLAGQSEIPAIARFAARRAVDADAFETLVDAIGNRPQRQISFLEGLRDGLEGRRSDLSPPPNWSGVYDQLRQSDEARVASLALDVAQQFGDADASLQFLAILRDSDAPPEQRREALRVLAEEQYPEVIDDIPGLLDDPAMRIAAIRAVAGFNDAQLGNMLLERYTGFNNAEKNETIRAMASRPVYGRLLTGALEDGEIPKRDVPVDVARQLQRVVGVGFVDVWGPIADDLTDEERAYAEYSELLTEEAIANADARRGRVVYQRTCGPCHKMYGEGGEIGPDLTGSNRHNVDYILRMVINPNEVIADAYRLVVITMRDGRTWSGNVVSESERQLTLRTVGLDEVVINKSDIQTREDTEVSLMPPRLFDTLSDDEVLDLVKYLQTDAQVALSVSSK
jgi:putative membrane-bound dehydrogenase-like protein